jgi:DNA polymerase (family 10)
MSTRMTNSANEKSQLNNDEIASHLDQIAEWLEAQNANPFRVRAYRMAAETLRGLQRPAPEILEIEGVKGLTHLPHIGESLAHSIEQLVDTGKINLLEHLRGETRPERVLDTVPGIGPILADRVHDQLGIETLTGLEEAAYDGRLAQVPGFGLKRLRGVRESLAGRFRRRPLVPSRARRALPVNQPPVSELLDVDREYREKAKAKKLPRITPKRFNPTHEPWLPVLHTERGQTHYTALFSNTARAHELGMVHDWVVIYRDDHNGAGQWTILTAHYGPLKGKRIAPGREAECETYYASTSESKTGQ